MEASRSSSAPPHWPGHQLAGTARGAQRARQGTRTAPEELVSRDDRKSGSQFLYLTFPQEGLGDTWGTPGGLAGPEGVHRALSEKTGKILTEFLRFYEDQYGVALFNSMRHEIEGTGLPQAQLLWRKVRGAGQRWGGLRGPGQGSFPLWASVSHGCWMVSECPTPASE